MRLVRVAAGNVQHGLEHLRGTSVSRKDRQMAPAYFGQPDDRSKHLPPRDRIPFWNLAQGDVVRVIAGSKEYKNRIGTIRTVDRQRNVAWLAEDTFARPGAGKRPASGPGSDEPIEIAATRPFQYSNLQLVLGNYTIRPSDGQPGQATLAEKLDPTAEPSGLARTIVATRLTARRVGWNRESRCFTWSRVPSAVRALKSDGSGYEPWRISWPPETVSTSSDRLGHVEWPIESQPKPPAPLPGPYDALPSTALRSTWLPPDLVERSIQANEVAAVQAPESQLGQPIWSHLGVLKTQMPELALSLDEFRNQVGAKRRLSVRKRFARQHALRKIASSPVLNSWRKSVNWQRGLAA